MHRLSALLLVIVALTLCFTTAMAAETRQYEMTQRSADDVARQIRDLYGNDNIRVTAQGQQLIVRGDAIVLDEIGQLVETMDVAPVQMRVSVRSVNSSMGKQGGAGVTISNNNVNVQATRKVTSTSGSNERSVIVQQGNSAQITNGQVRSIPYAIKGGRNPAAILEQVETRSGFIVTPQYISDDAIELSIVSFEEDPDSGVPGYETEALLTLRRVEPGRWVSLGSVQQSRSSSQSGIVYQTGSNSSESNEWQVRVDRM